MFFIAVLDYLERLICRPDILFKPRGKLTGASLARLKPAMPL
jgi:hypothetical protein